MDAEICGWLGLARRIAKPILTSFYSGAPNVRPTTVAIMAEVFQAVVVMVSWQLEQQEEPL